MKENAEMIAKLRALKTAEEYRAFVGNLGRELTEEKAAKEFEILQSRLTPDNKALDEDELIAVNGGNGLPECTDSAYGECVSTVEAGSWCGGLDACFLIFILYDMQNYVS